VNTGIAPGRRADVGRGNNFDTLRILAAVAVLVSHAVPIAHGENLPQPLVVFSHQQTDLGYVAVLVFFVISGYLITRSFDHNPSPLRFLQARALRIFPGLFVALVFTAAVLGATVTTLPLSRYYLHSDTIRYVGGGLSLHWLQHELPGVFRANFTSTVNGSLWTLKFEFEMYLMVLALGVCRLLTRRIVLALWLVALVLCWLDRFGDEHVQFAAPFLGGAVLYLWRDRVPLDGRVALVCAAVVTASMPVGGFRPAFAAFGAYLVVYLAVAPAVRLPNLARRGDLSYGIFILAWPIQQTAALLLGPAATWYWNIVLSLPVVLALAWLSWRFVEEPALRLRRVSLVPAAGLSQRWLRM
jgi:peptidoglycan/LPS O-acetylase OafA/YrhL